MTGTLFVVATPIGNLEDITLRALRTLREVSVVAAEDTRRTRHLLHHYEIKTPLISLHEHNERRRVAGVVDRLRQGQSVALVSDAGTPGISDPGAILVRAVREAGLRVEAVPGPSAITAVLGASGLSFDRFVFAGFPPIRSRGRTRWLQWVDSFPDIPVVFFEAPHRLARTMTELQQKLVNRPIIWARELTKVHEEWSFRLNDRNSPPGQSTSVPTVPTSLPTAKGEFVLILAPRAGTEEIAEPTDEQIVRIFGQITETQEFDARRGAIRAVARRLQISSNAVFDALERVKISSRS